MNDHLRVAVLEDEPCAARLLVGMLRQHEGVELLGSFGCSADALAHLRSHDADALFLDVEVPGCDGFTLLRHLPAGRTPAVVVVTAHDTYASRAFEVAAVDFLLKPFDEARLATAVARVRTHVAGRVWPQERDHLLRAVEEMRPKQRFLKHLAAWMPGNQRAVLLAVDQIAWIEADRKRLLTHCATGTYDLAGPLHAIETALDPEVFVRVSRSALVNIEHVREIQRWFRGDYLLVMRDGSRVRSSASYRPALERLLRVG